MELAQWGALLMAVGLGVFVASIMHSRDIARAKRRRREQGILHSVGERAGPFFVDRDGNYETNFDHPDTKNRLAAQLGSLRTDSEILAKRTFTDGGRYNWIVHSEYHLSLWLLGEWLQYWPTKSKWRWNRRTYTGDVNAFIEEQLELHQFRSSEDAST